MPLVIFVLRVKFTAQYSFYVILCFNSLYLNIMYKTKAHEILQQLCQLSGILLALIFLSFFLLLGTLQFLRHKEYF